MPVGGSAYFFCTVVASGTPGYQWYFNGVPMVGQTARTLLLPSVTTGHAGDYKVRVTAGRQTSNSAPATLTVVQPLTSPQIVSQPQGQSALVGETVSFSLQAQGSGTVSYRWSKDGAYLSDDLRITGSAGSPLQIANVQSSDAGSYRLRVSNQAGSVDSGARGGKERGHFCPQPCERRQDVDRERLLAAAPPQTGQAVLPHPAFQFMVLMDWLRHSTQGFGRVAPAAQACSPAHPATRTLTPTGPFPTSRGSLFYVAKVMARSGTFTLQFKCALRRTGGIPLGFI